MLKPINAILWRRCHKATLDTLDGVSTGQYHITLQTHDFSQFFSGVARTSPTDLGGYELDVPIESFSGLDPIETSSLIFRFMGQASARKDWYIQAQRPDTAYPLWRKGRGYVTADAAIQNDYIIIARDTDGKFHARWIRGTDVSALPDKLRTMISTAEAGWGEVL